MSRSSRAWLAYAVAARCCSPVPISASSSAVIDAGYSIIDHRRVIAALDAANRREACDGRRAAPADRDLRDLGRDRPRDVLASRGEPRPTSRRRFSPRKRSSCSIAASCRRTMALRAYGSRASTVAAGGRRAPLRGPARAGSGNRSQSASVAGHGKVAARGRAGWSNDVVRHGGSRTRGDGEL